MKNDDKLRSITICTMDDKEYLGEKFEYKDNIFILQISSDCVKIFPKENIKYIQVIDIDIAKYIGD